MNLTDQFKSVACGIGAAVIPAALVCAPTIGAFVDGQTTLGQNGAITQVIATLAAAMSCVGLYSCTPRKTAFAVAVLATAGAIGYGAYEGTLNPVNIAHKLGAPQIPSVK